MAKILGLIWKSFEKLIRRRETITRITKRSTLSFASELLDSLGFVEPVTVKANIMTQDLWKQNLSWNEDLPDEKKEQWLKWIGDINNLTSIEVPIPYILKNTTDTTTHIPPQQPTSLWSTR